jgi:hypothetical protein
VIPALLLISETEVICRNRRVLLNIATSFRDKLDWMITSIIDWSFSRKGCSVPIYGIFILILTDDKNVLVDCSHGDTTYETLTRFSQHEPYRPDWI